MQVHCTLVFHIAGYPTLLAGTSTRDFELKDGKTEAQTSSDMLHIASGDGRKIDTIARAMSSYLGNLSSSAFRTAVADDASEEVSSISTDIVLPSQDDFYAELTRRLHTQAALESTLGSQETSNVLDSWVASRSNAADIEMALVMSAQNVISRQFSAAATNGTTEQHKVALQQAAIQTGKLFSLVGPGYDGHRWAKAFDTYVRHPQVSIPRSTIKIAALVPCRVLEIDSLCAMIDVLVCSVAPCEIDTTKKGSTTPKRLVRELGCVRSSTN